MADKYIQAPKLMDIAKYFYGILWLFRRQFVKPSYFKFNNRDYVYFSHPYNGTWMNERAVEISLIWEEVSSYAPGTVLEVGNVLSHYFDVKHLVVDKYEKFAGGIAEDIIDVDLTRKFDCIVSISTVEHIGWDEIPRVPGKHILAIKKMRQLLQPGGKMFITFPLGHNPSLDQDLFSGRLNCDQMFYFKRLTRELWVESSQDQVRGSTYGKKYRSTDGLAVCVWRG